MPLLILIIINGSAISLDYWLVVWAKLGPYGLALANIISQTIGLAIGLIAIHSLYKPFHKQRESIFEINSMVKFFNINKDIFIRTLCLMVTIATFTKESSALGLKVVAANAILLSMHHFSSYFLDGFAISCEALVGEAIGLNNYSKLIRAIKHCAKFSIYVGLGLSLSYALFGTIIINALSSHSDLVQIANAHLIWLIVLPTVSVASFLLDGIFIGATWSKPMRNTMIISSFVVFLPLTHILKDLGNNGLWLSFIAFIISRGLFLGFCLYRQLLFLRK